MSIEKNIERIADALERLAGATEVANDMLGSAVAPDPEPKPKAKRKTKAKKAEAAPEPAPQPEPAPVNDPAPAEKGPEAAKPVEQAETGETMTPDDLNRGLMEIAQKGSPDAVNKIIAIMGQAGASNAADVPPHRRQWVLDEARKAVAGTVH